MDDVKSCGSPPPRPVTHLELSFTWFYDPVSEKPPGDVREKLFAAVVCQLGYQATGQALSTKRVHDYFTQLLRGWNPITAWTMHRCQNTWKMVPDNGDVDPDRPLFEEHVQPLLKELLDFERPVTASDRYQYLAHFSRVCAEIRTAPDNVGACERFALMAAAMWLLSRRIPSPACLDPISLRACMDLHYRDRMFASKSATLEYLLHTELSKVGWLNTQITRLLSSSRTTDDVVDQIVYLAWFLSLTSVRRMYGNCVATNQTEEDLNQNSDETRLSIVANDMLQRQISLIRQAIDSLPQRLHEEQDEQPNKFSKFLNVFGIRPKRKGK